MVLTPAGARGLDDEAGAYIKVDMKEQPGQTAEVLLDLLNNPERRRKLENNAWGYVRRDFSRDAYTRAMDEVISALAPSRAA
jgi:glycosyltransferase involved in cell wall biosynthesis